MKTIKSLVKDNVQHVFIIGAKSIGQYGGYETFVDRLVNEHKNESNIRYHIACKANGDGFMDETKLNGVDVTKKSKDGNVVEFTYCNAHVFKIFCPNIGPAVAIYYDRVALKYSIKYCIEHHIEHPIFYILTCRIGFFINSFVKQIKALGGMYYLNPDGHEWMRAKWSALVRKYWKWSERKMVNAADVVVCDSVNIEKYIRQTYCCSCTTFIPYGSDTVPSVLSDDDQKFVHWLNSNSLKAREYYLVVGRFVPENNYETMIREFMKSNSTKNFAIITNMNEKLKKRIEDTLHFSVDVRIKFVGTVYDHELLKKIRENAYGYFHGHEVGGTNPSLLEALGSTELNLLLDIGFNREVGAESALYWKKDEGSLARLIGKTDRMSAEERAEYGRRAKERIRNAYSWEIVGKVYKRLWLNGCQDNQLVAPDPKTSKNVQ